MQQRDEQQLRHVTVLEEAHNLLRKTSAEQSQEGAIAGKYGGNAGKCYCGNAYLW